MAKKQFKAESKRLLDLMINSIYTHKEIFLREIISNASDAIDKLCYVSLTDSNVGMAREDFCIQIATLPEARTLCVSDNGIGMTKEDLEQNLGIIAKSGSMEFRNKLDEEQNEAADVDIIGQFGVGFYSAFMVSSKVVVTTRAYGSDTAYRWQSEGADGYSITECEKEFVGTQVLMELKPDTEEESYSDFLQSWKLRELIKKYSDYVRWPIRMDVEASERVETDELDENGEKKFDYITKTEEQTINSMVPIWQRPKSEVTDEDCFAFYKEKFRDYEDPASVIHVDAEGLFSYRAMLFLPECAPYDFYSRGFEPGLQLYSSGVMIMEKCADLLPDCFRFVRGVVDSPDLSLNISRELLQHNRQLKVIANNLEKKIKSELLRLQKDEREKYEKIYKSFGLSLKYGIVSDYGAKKELLQDLLLFHSDKQDKLISLEEYAKNMPEEQKMVYYVCAESAGRARKLPQTEPVRERGFDILCLSDDVDEFVMQSIQSYDEKKLCNVSVDDLLLETEEEKAESEKENEEFKPMLDAVKSALEGKIADVRISSRLKSHPVCLTTSGGVTIEMEKYFSALPDMEETVKAERVLELNASHPAITALKAAAESNPERTKKLSEILLAQAMLIADVSLDDPSAYAELVCELF